MDIFLPGWHRQIDMDRLNLAYYEDCILGQCFKGYSRGMRALKLIDDQENQLGFCLFEDAEKRHYLLLTACWKTLINERFENDKQEIQTAALPTPPKDARQRNHPATNAV